MNHRSVGVDISSSVGEIATATTAADQIPAQTTHTTQTNTNTNITTVVVETSPSVSDDVSAGISGASECTSRLSSIAFVDIRDSKLDFELHSVIDIHGMPVPSTAY